MAEADRRRGTRDCEVKKASRSRIRWLCTVIFVYGRDVYLNTHVRGVG